MNRRNLIAGAVVAICLVLLIVYKQRETPEPVAPSPPAGSATPTAPTMKATPNEKVRKMDAAGRKALQERIANARTTRIGGADSTGTSGTSKSPPPSLPALPGTISRDDIRAGVRAVIPLLAECYDAAKDRLSPKEGKIVVHMHLAGEPEVGTLIDKAEVAGDAHFTADKELVECLQQTMLSVELPPMAEGGTIDVTYPLAFSP